jgi:uncharacterized surface protein with fasciclin (FAS1) repeats
MIQITRGTGALTAAVACLTLTGLSSPAFAGSCSSAEGEAHEAKMTEAKMTDAKGSDIVDVAAGAGTFNTLLAAAEAAGLVDALKSDGPLTVFAPTDEAFAALGEEKIAELLKPENKALLASILTYHVAPGKLKAKKVVAANAIETLNGQRIDITLSDDGAFVDGAKILKTDIKASNGVIHVIDTVILPSSENIVATAVEAGSFNTLAAALQAAGLVEALQGEGPFTVFAPTDEAFAALPEGTVETLLQPENKDQLAAVLKYHVVAGRVFSDAAAAGATVETLQGQTVTTRSDDGRVFVNDAQVVAADIDTSNGVIHVINKVILPSAESADAGAEMRVRKAIAMGVPRFNHGDHSGCAAIYEIAVMSLASDTKVPAEVNAAANRALAKAGNTHTSTKRAWIYRHMMDDALDMMEAAGDTRPMAMNAR